MPTTARMIVLRDGPEAGAVAMARDQALGRALRESEIPEIVARTHGWAGPTLTLGRAQDPTGDLEAEAGDRGVLLAKRPTGGGWLLHLPGDAALSLALSLALGGLSGAGAFRGTARRVARAIAAALTQEGVPADVLTGHGHPAMRSEICFSRGDRDEVAVGPTKVAGVALARLGSAVLVQTALPLVEAAGDLEEFERRWDPARASAVARLAGLDRKRLLEGVLEGLAAEFSAVPEEGRWRASWLAAVEVS